MGIGKLFKGYNKFILLLIILFVSVRLYLIFKLPDVIDESMYLYKLYLMTKGWQIYVNFGDNRMPGFFYMAYPFMYIYTLFAKPPFNDIVFIGRISTILTSLASIVFIYKIGKYIKGERTGLIAIMLFMINPFVLGFYSDIFLENFMIAFSLAGFYYFIKGLEENSDKNLFVASLLFGIAVSIKQTAIILYPISIFVLLLKNIRSPGFTFLRKILVTTAGMAIVGSIIVGYFLYKGILGDFIYAMTYSVQQSYAWANPTQDTIINDYILPSLEANELLTLIFGFCGIIFAVFLFFARKDKYFGIKTLALWVIGYVAVMSYSNNYGFYYIPIIPSLVIISAYLIDNYVIDNFISIPTGYYRKAFVIVLVGLLLAIDFYHVAGQYQEFTMNPAKEITILTPPINQQIFIGDYLYNHTAENDKIFSIASIYPLIAGRDVVNHFTIAGNNIPTTDQLIQALSDPSVKYAVIDDRTLYHFKRRWGGGDIQNLHLSMNIKLDDIGNKNNDGFVIELRNRMNSSSWWVHQKNLRYPVNDVNNVNYELSSDTGKLETLNVNLSKDFISYFGYVPDEYTLTIWSNANDGSHIKYEIKNMKVWDDNNTYINQNFTSAASSKNFSIIAMNGKNTTIGQYNNAYINNGLNIETFNQNYGLSTVISSGVAGYIYGNFEKEIDFIIIARQTEDTNSTVSIYRKIGR